MYINWYSVFLLSLPNIRERDSQSCMLAQRAFSVGRFAAKLVWSVPISLSNPQEDVDIEDFKSSFPNETSIGSSTKRKRIVYKTKRSNINVSSDFGFGEVPLKSLACNWLLSSFFHCKGVESPGASG